MKVEHEIKTIQDIYRVVTNENIDCFMKDLRNSLDVFLSLSDLSKAICNASGIDEKLGELIPEKYIWIDDGKIDMAIMIINFKLLTEKING
jgi:hypothetical protein